MTPFSRTKDMRQQLYSYGYTLVEKSGKPIHMQWRPLYRIFRESFSESVDIYYREMEGVKDFLVSTLAGTSPRVINNILAKIQDTLPDIMKRQGAVVIGQLLGIPGFRMCIDSRVTGLNPWDVEGPNYPE